jgi:hypothetical protein
MIFISFFIPATQGAPSPDIMSQYGIASEKREFVGRASFF